MLNEFTYSKKISSVLVSEICVIRNKNPMSQIEMKVQKLPTKHKTSIPTALTHKLTPYHSKSSHLYGPPEMHKLGILRLEQ